MLIDLGSLKHINTYKCTHNKYNTHYTKSDDQLGHRLMLFSHFY
jgi:hypothetical protein